jgi:ABC-2 type transport system permease protein
MAGLTESPIQSPSQTHVQPWTTTQSRAQFTALAQLRWCIFLNGFRRKGGVGELIARIIFVPVIGIIAFFPILSAGFAGYYLVSSNRMAMLPALTWAIFALMQLVSINIAPPTLSFDINTIIRFPLSFPRYLAARLFFGLLSASNVIGTLALLSADIGISIAKPSLALWSTLLLAIFAIANVFFTRMIFAWIDRWLSTRHARELFTAFLVFGSLGFQYLNVTFNPGLQNHHHHTPSHIPALLKILHHLQPIAAVLPPGLTASSILAFSQSRIVPAAVTLIGLIVFGILFLAVYAWRMRREFHGENLSELALPKQSIPSRTIAPAASTITHTRTLGLSPILTACLEKEFLYLRRNTNQLYGFLAPIFMVFLFSSRVGSSGRFGEFVFPAAVAYSILGISILSYNALGVDGSGIQLYFIAPIRLRDIFLAKNLIIFLLNLIELILIYVVICFVAHPPSLVIGLATTCWLLFSTFLNGAIGNYRSLSAPKKVDLAKASRKQTSQLSALIALGIAILCCILGYAIVAFTNHLHHPWLMIPIFLTLAVIGFILYLQVLNRLDTFALNHREQLAEELCKA